MNPYRIGFLLAFGVIPAIAVAQSQRQAIASSDVLSQIPMINYQAGAKSSLDFRPTPVAKGEGSAQVEYKDGNARIKAKVKGLPPPPELGPYTTYVLWALTPDGRAANQGVIGGIEGDKGELDTKYGAPQFALIVTAEPHFAVTAPSNMIVLYNVGDKVKGTQTKVTSLTEQSDYSRMAPIAAEKNRPAELVAAEYSVEIANAAGAQLYASALYSTAKQKLADAEAAVGSKQDRKKAPQLAHEATLAGEDARREAMNGKVKADAEAAQAKAAQEAAAKATAEAQANARVAARQDLMNRLNEALPTRETDRGLVSEIGGLQFATGAAALTASARESLARFAGIVASYPDLQVKIEGHTDNTGSEQANDTLSTQRAIAVRDYLIAQHVPASNIDAEGLGSAHPIADNGTAEGRARNRRVELVRQ